jgi:arsenite methyltransferase
MTIELEVSRSSCCSSEEKIISIRDATEIKGFVQEKYRTVAEQDSGCGCGCSEDASADSFAPTTYVSKKGYVADADLGLGCGIPTDLAGIEPGDHVLDLGSGAGIDAFIAAAIVGNSGTVTGIDFTPEMVALARLNASKLDIENVIFEHGEIESLPFLTDTFDVVVSNCVLNLVPDKFAAFSEMARVLKPGSHFCVSDIVTTGELPAHLRRSAEAYAGCVAGAIDRADYLALIEKAGFLSERDIKIPESMLIAATESGVDASDGTGIIASITVRGDLPSSR